MTLEEIKKSDKECSFRLTSATSSDAFPFPTILLGSRVKIPRRAFIKAMEGE